MFDPSDYQNTSGVNSGVTNYMNGLGSQGGQAGGAAGGNWLQQAGAWMNSDSMSQGMGGMMGGMSNGDMIMQSDQMGGQLMGLLAGQNESTVGNIVKSIPGLSTVGNLINAAFGSHINEEFVRQTVLGTNAQKTKTFNSNTNSDVLNDWRGFNFLSNVTKDEVGSDGWFSNKAKNKTNELNNNINAANDLAILNFGHAVDNADANSDLRIAQSMVAAYGGPINSFRKYYGDGGSPYTVGATINSLYAFSPREEFLGEPSHHYDFTQSEEWANAHGYYPDARGHRDDRVKKPAHPSHPSRGTWNGDKFELTDLGMQNPNYTLFGLNDGGQDPQAILTYKGGVVLPEITVTPKENYIFNPYDNIILHQKSFGGNLFNTPQFFTFEPQIYDDGGYLSKAKALIRQNEGWREKPYKDAPKGKNWRSVGYGFNDSGFREKYPEGISKHYEHGITKKQAEEELDYFLNKAEKQLKSIYGKQWNDFTDSQKAAILDTYYQRPASVGKSSRFYKAVTAGEDAGRYLGVAGYSRRNNIRQSVFGGSQDYVNLGIETGNTESNPSTLQEVTPFTPVVHDLDLSGITPTQAKALELNLTSPTFDLSMFGKPMTAPTQQAVPTVGTVEDFLASYGDFEENLFKDGGNLYGGGGYTKTYIDGRGKEVTFRRFPNETDEQYEARYAEKAAVRERNAAINKARFERRIAANKAGAARLNRAINTVTNVMEEQAKATPFTGQEIQQAAEEQRQEKLDKWGDYKKGINATITAAELGLSGASLLGAYANWRNWATAANATKRGIANLLQKAQLPMQIGGTLIDGYQTYDALQNNDNFNANYNGISAGLGVAGSVGASDVFLNSRFHSPKIDRVLDAMGVIQNSGDFIKFGYDSMFGNEKAEGGSIHIDPSKKGTFTAAASKYGLEGNLFEGGGWMDFFQSWNQAKGGNDYFSQGNGNWKPSDGLQKNTSNGSVGDWMGQAQTTINTITNWGKEDPSLGRGGGYSTFGMAAYDIMKAIRDATKSKRESIDQKLGIPVYARGGRLFEGGGSMSAMGYAQIANSALKLASNAKAQASLDVDEDKIDRSINRFGQGFDEIVGNVNTNGDLLDLWQQNETLAPNLTMRDFRDKSYFDDFLNGYAASWEGFNAGAQTGNPYITAATAIVGGLSSNIASFIGRNKASNAADEANRKIEEANERRMDNLLAAAERVDKENDLRILQNMGANGGKLNMGFGLRNPFIMPDGTANPLFRAFGGGLTHGVGDTVDISPEEARYLKSLGYEFKVIG